MTLVMFLLEKSECKKVNELEKRVEETFKFFDWKVEKEIKYLRPDILQIEIDIIVIEKFYIEELEKVFDLLDFRIYEDAEACEADSEYYDDEIDSIRYEYIEKEKMKGIK